MCADSFSNSAEISADGRHVVFKSRATNLVPGDANGRDDVFIRDLDSGTTRMVSVAFGAQSGGNRESRSPDVSADGRYVVFESSASNLIAGGDTNGFADIYLRDLATGTTTRISQGHDGSWADNHSYSPCISDDGSLIAFHSEASNLVLDDANGVVRDVFVHDRLSGTTRLVHRAFDGGLPSGYAENCGMSGDGRFVAYESISSNLVASDPNGAINDIFRTWIGGDRLFDDGFDIVR